MLTTHQKSFIMTFSLGFATAMLVMSGVIYWRSAQTIVEIIPPIVESIPPVPAAVMEPEISSISASAPTNTIEKEKSKHVGTVLPARLEMHTVKPASTPPPLVDKNGFQISHMGFSFRKSNWKNYQLKKKSPLSDLNLVNELSTPPLRKDKIVQFQIRAYTANNKTLKQLHTPEKSYRIIVKKLPTEVAHALSLVRPKESILLKPNVNVKEKSNFKWPLALSRGFIYEITRN